MKKNAEYYYLEKGFNCAETTLRLANDYYNLDISDDDLKLVAGFGGGFGCKLTCGNLCADMAVLSKLFVKEKAHENPEFGKLCKSFVYEYKKLFGGTTCLYIKKKMSTPETRCLKVVEDNFELLKDFVKRHEAK